MPDDLPPDPSMSQWAALRRLPFPLQVLVAWAVFRAAGRVLTTILAWDYRQRLYDADGIAIAPMFLRIGLGVLALGVAAALVHGALGVLRGRRRSLTALPIAYALDVALVVLWTPTALLLQDSPISVVAVRCLPPLLGEFFWVAVLWSYMQSREVERAVAGRPLPEAPLGPRRFLPALPLTATLLAAASIVSGAIAAFVAAYIGWRVVTRGPGAGGLGSTLASMARGYAGFAGWAVAGLAGLTGAVGLLARRDWGRWVLMAVTLLDALRGVGGALGQYGQMLHAEFATLPQAHWDLLSHLVDAAVRVAFVIAFLSSVRVREAMRRDAP
jgi:hypothetical protein